MIPRLASFFQIRPGEGSLALLGAAFFLLSQASQVFAANTADALLFERYGVDILPVLFIVLGAATLVATTSYSAVLGRPDRVRFSIALILFAAALGVVGWLATFLAPASLYPILWLAIALINALVGTVVWVLAGEACDPRQAKRLFAFFASAGILGSVLAGFLTGPLAQSLGTPQLLLFFSGLLVVAGLIARSMTRSFGRAPRRQGPSASPWRDLRRAHDLVWRNPTMRLVAVSAVLFSILFFSVTFPFNVQVSRALPSEADIAGFLGVFGGLATGVTFLVSLFLASRIYGRIGIVNAILLLPLTYLAGFILWSVTLNLETASVFRFAQLVLVGGIASTAYANLFNVVPAGQRAQVRAYQSGPPAQVGVMLSGVLLLIGQRGLTESQALALGIAVSILCAAAVWRMRSSYGASLLDALREGVTDVFAPASAPREGIAQDAQARRVAAEGLEDPRPTIRRAAIGILVKLQAVDRVGEVAGRASDEDPGVRCEAALALGALAGPDAIRPLRTLAADGDAGVRASAVRSLSQIGQLQPQALAAYLSDPSAAVRAQAAIAAFRMGQEGTAWSVIAGLLRSDDDATRLAAVEGCAEVRAPESTGELVRILKAGPRPLQLAAIRSLRASRDPDSLVAVLQTLSDPDPALRHAAGDALAGWDGAAESLMAILTNGPEAAQDEAVRALRGAGDPARGRVLTWAEGRLHEAVQLRGSSDSLKTFCVADSDAAYLIELLQRDETRQEGRVLGALESVESPGSMRVVARALRARDRDLNSQALEALETLGDRNLTQGLIRLMEPVGPSASGGSGEATLRGLAAHGRAWYRILAFRVLARQAADPAAIRRQVARDSDPLVRSCLAGGRAETVGGEMIETSPTLSTVQRVLFLKDVPLFRLLEPEDLERIAAIAQERLYDPRETICREGEVGDEMHILVEGRVEISKLVEGQAHMLRRLEAGEHLGELAILREQPRSASVVCITRVRSLVLSGEALRSILQDRPAVGLAMLESLADRMSTLG